MTQPIRVTRYPTARAFLSATEDYLNAAEVANNLMLGIAREISERGAAPGEALVSRGGTSRRTEYGTLPSTTNKHNSQEPYAALAVRWQLNCQRA